MVSAAKKGEKAKLPKEYEHHSPGSVQETDDVVVFAHQTDEEAPKWANTAISHVGDGSDAPVRVGVVIGEFHNILMDRMLEDARIAAEDMNATIDEVVWVPGTYEAPLVVEKIARSTSSTPSSSSGTSRRAPLSTGKRWGPLARSCSNSWS